MVIKSIESLKYSPIESRRFGIKIYRGVLDNINPNEILSTIIKHNVDVAIISIPAERQDSLSCLQEIGIPYLIADILVYYYVDLKTHKPREPRNKDLEFIKCDSQHFEILNKLISEIFSGYKNHYTSNPFLSVDLIEVYKEWARSYVTDENNGRCAWLVKRANQFIGFATCTFEEKESEIILNGVIPSAAGMGVYGDLIKYLQQFFKDNGYSVMKVSTQVHNYAAQKVWSRESFVMKQAFVTVHINSLMNVSRIEKKVFDLTVSSDDVMRYCTMGGDANRHFDEENAYTRGVERIAHELLSKVIASKYYYTEFPGDGTLFIGYLSKFLKSVYLDRHYRLEISFPSLNPQKGIYKSLVKILDYSGEVCFFCYNDFVKR